MSNYFTDRVVQHPGRITLTPTGGSDEYDVDRAEGTVTTPGTPFNAASMNGAVDLYGFYYGTCSTAASTAAKVVTCAGFALVTGAKIAVKFTYANTYNGQITLNVNGTGAKNVYDYGQFYDGQTRCAWDANETKVFIYDGTRWNLVNGELITDASLDALETALGITSTRDRLYNILNAITSWATSPPLAVTTKSNSGTIAANNYGALTISESKTGYTPLGVVGYSTSGVGAGNCAIIKYQNTISGSSISTEVGLRNVSGSAATPTVVLSFLWLKNI